MPSPIRPRLSLSDVLQTLYEATGTSRRVDASALARSLGVSPTRVGEALVTLDRRGLVDAAHARLTMRGLAVAASLAGGASPARLDLQDHAA